MKTKLHVHLRRGRIAREDRQRPYSMKARREDRFSVSYTSTLSSFGELSFIQSLIVAPSVHGILSEQLKSLKDPRSSYQQICTAATQDIHASSFQLPRNWWFLTCGGFPHPSVFIHKVL